MTFLFVASFPHSLLNFRGPLIDAILLKGIKVHVVAPDLHPQSDVRRQLESKGVYVHDIHLQRTGMNPVSDLRTLISLWRLMRRLRPDYVLSYTIKPVVFGGLAAWLASVPNRYALITGLGYAFQGAESERRLLKKIAQFLYRFSLKKSNKVFFQNPDDHALFKSMGIIGESFPSVVVNGSGVDTSHFSEVPPPQNMRFLLIARLLGDKGVREYAQAAEIVQKSYPHAEFGLAGWVDDNPDSITHAELESWIEKGIIAFHGRLKDVRPVIANCAVYVLPSYREGTPRTVLEAMAMGRAIITTDAPGCRETVKPGKNGFLVAVNSVDQLAEAMIRFIEKPQLINSMGRCSREIAEQKYDVHSVNHQMLSEMSLH